MALRDALGQLEIALREEPLLRPLELDLAVIGPDGVCSTWRVLNGSPERNPEAERYYSVLCASKPVVAAACMAALEFQGVSASASLDAWGYLTEGTLGELLSHRLGLALPAAAQFRTADPSVRRDMVSGSALHFTRGRCSYSEVSAMWILADIASGDPESFMTDIGRQIRRVGLGGLVLDGLDARNWPIGLYSIRDSTGRLSILPHDLSILRTRDRTPGLSGYATVAGLAQWYHELSSHLAHSLAPSALFPTRGYLDSMFRWSREERDCYDKVLRRNAPFGAGFMVDLRNHGFGESVSRSAFGHLGWAGASWGFHDPEIGISCAGIVNIIISHEEQWELRSRVVDSVLRCAL